MMGDAHIHALDGVSLHIKKGEFVSIVGPSGSGKSTMLHLIGALDRPSKGTVLIEDRDVSRMTDNELAGLRCRKIRFVFQTFNLIPRLTAMENVMLPMWFANNIRSERAASLLKDVGLSHRMSNRPAQLSGGGRGRGSQ